VIHLSQSQLLMLAKTNEHRPTNWKPQLNHKFPSLQTKVLKVSKVLCWSYTTRNGLLWLAHREILLNQIKIRLYLLCTDWKYHLIKSNRNQIVFTMHRLIWNNKRTLYSLLFQINRCMVNTIWFRFDLLRFLCVWYTQVYRLQIRIKSTESDCIHHFPND